MRAIRALFCAATLVALAPLASAEEAILRAAPSASGPAITLGDLFENAGEAAKRAVAPAPAPGRTTHLAATLVASAAQAGGLSWTPPAGLERVAVTRGSGSSGAAVSAGSAGVRRGEIVALTYQTASLRIATRARALGDAAIGEKVALANLETERTIEAVVTGAGTAVAGPSP